MDTDLFPDETGFSPRTAWRVIDAARRQLVSGELTLPTEPATRVYLRDGVVYYAERSSDCTLPVRLMTEGVINREQMRRGTVTVNGVEHIGRMFDADPTIDRRSVEVCAEQITDDVMIGVANRTIDGYTLILYRRHPSGVDRWSQPVPAGDLPTEPPRDLFAAPITQPVSVTPPIAVGLAAAPSPITEPVPIVVPVTPVAEAPAPEVLAPAVRPWSDADASTIADAVAAAIERAFATTTSAG